MTNQNVHVKYWGLTVLPDQVVRTAGFGLCGGTHSSSVIRRVATGTAVWWWEHLQSLMPQQSAGHWQYWGDWYWWGRIDITDWHSWVLFGLSEFCCSYQGRAVSLECTPFCSDKVRSGFLSFLFHQAILNLISYPNPVTWFKCWQFLCSMTLVKVALSVSSTNWRPFICTLGYSWEGLYIFKKQLIF